MVRRFLLNAGAASQRLLLWAGIRLAAAQPVVAGPVAVAVPGAGLYALCALLAPAFCFLHGLDAFPLRDNNEGLYAEIAREMLATGKFIIPHLDGVPYIEKPPLLYWLMSLSMAVFGPTAAAARLVSAAAMFGLSVFLFRFCSRHGHAQAGCYASAGLASALPVALISHTVLFDPLLTALTGASLLSFLEYYLSGRLRAYRFSMLWLALAVLEKGALALVLAGGIVALFFLLMRERRAWRLLGDPAALAIFGVVAGAWHLAAVFLQPGFSWFYFINEHLLRFLGKREPHDYHLGPIYYYLPALVAMLLPWSAFLLLLLRPQPARDPASATLLRFCQAWTVFPILFFSLSQAKAGYYLLVAMPGLALWLGIDTAARVQAGGGRRLAYCWAIAASTCAMALWALLGGSASALRGAAVGPLLLPWAVLVLAGGRWFAQLRGVRERNIALLCIVLAVAPLLTMLLRLADRAGLRYSSQQLAALIQQQPGPEPEVYVYRDFEDVFSTLPFYLGHTVKVIDSASRDLEFGCRIAAGPDSACISPQQFRQASAGAPVAVAVRAAHADQFLSMAGNTGWRVQVLGDKLVFFSHAVRAN
jgi:4-amino-4-deoxy-L-arabinose transferase-like glycosyltransferase